jgi:hypothetical protein
MEAIQVRDGVEDEKYWERESEKQTEAGTGGRCGAGEYESRRSEGAESETKQQLRIDDV